MTGNIILHTAGSFFETGLGIWIFAKVFPKREGFQNRHVAGEVVMYALMLTIVCVNFLNHVPTVVKAGGCAGWILGIVIYRCGCERKCSMQGTYFLRFNQVLAGLALISMFAITAWNSWLSYVSEIVIILGNLFVPFFLYRYYQCSLVQAYVYEFLYMATVNLVKCAYMVYVSGIISNVTSIESNRLGRMHSYTSLLTTIVIYVIFFLLVKWLAIWEILGDILSRYKRSAFTIAMGEAALIYLFTDMGEDGFKTREAATIMTVALTFIIGFLLLLIRLFTNNMKGEKRLLNVRNEAIEQQYQELRAAYEQNRRLLHDEKHMLQYIEECLANDDIQTAREFTGKCRANVGGKVRQAWTGIPTLDFILNMKKRRMDELSIEFRLHAQLDELPFDEADFVVLLGNLFDNAIEAAKKCEMRRREIVLCVRTVNNMFLLQMNNTSTAAPVKRRERFITSKAEKEKHGWGIESVRHIVDKYDGMIDFRYSDQMFECRIMLNMYSGEG